MDRPSGYRPSEAYIGLGLVSAGALAFEVTLTRLFAVQQFHHFAFVVVSLAVMGSAASALLLALRPRLPNLPLLSSAFAASIAVSYATINYLPFDSFSIAWDEKQVWILVLYFLAAGLPFLLAGWAVGGCLSSFRTSAHRIYAANLLGSGAGCLLGLGGLSLLGGEGAVILSITLGLLGSAAFIRSLWARLGVAGVAAGLMLIGAVHPSALALRLAPYKPLATMLMVSGARHTLTRWSASSRVDVVETDTLHAFPGLGLSANVSLPKQVALFLDGDGPIPITSMSPEDRRGRDLASHMPSSLAYLLRPGARALVIQPGAGLDPLLALAAGASHVTLPLDEPLVVEALNGPYAGFSRHLLSRPDVSVIPRSSRGVLRLPGQSYEVIQFALSDPYRPVTSGAFSLTESYVMTTEALADGLANLDNSGLLVITRWLGTPPSEESRAWSTLLAALREFGIEELSPHLVAYRSMRTATIIASLTPFTAGELATVRSFLEANRLDPVFLPHLNASELNQHNRLPYDYYHDQFVALLEDPASALSASSFNLVPPADNRPFFFHFFRWRQTPEVIATLGMTWQPFGGSGYLVLLALLGLVCLLATPLGVIPWVLLVRRQASARPGLRVSILFGSLGMGFLLVEIPLIQRMTLLLDRPAVSFATVLFTLLLASGLGSLLSTRFALRSCLGALVIALGLLAVLLPLAVDAGLPWSLPARLALTAGVLAPAGFLMGIPFAASLSRLERHHPGLTPWAWGINGACSGISGVAAAMVSLDLGLTATLSLGALFYLVAWLMSPGLGD